jgi:L-ribulose-5-phosphate 3-epimerase
MKRRDFMKKTGTSMIAAGALANASSASESLPKGKFDISVAAWSWHKMFFAGKITQIDQPRLVKEAGATGLELVNSFFPSPQYGYLKQLMKRADDEGVKILLIMCDNEGDMSSPNFRERRQAVINHRKWVDIAAVLGCHSIRCNSGNKNVSPEEDMKASADSFWELSEYARQYNINVTIENHWQRTEDPKWLVGLMKMVDAPNFGTLPDFGNFPEEVDRYKAIEMMMPFAKAVSAKCYDFNEEGFETKIDYARMMKIVFDADYHGYVGVEYEGRRLSELDGIAACVKLLKRFQA